MNILYKLESENYEHVMTSFLFNMATSWVALPSAGGMGETDSLRFVQDESLQLLHGEGTKWSPGAFRHGDLPIWQCTVSDVYCRS